MKIAFVGAGNMGGAIVRGLYQSGLCKASDLFVADVYQPNLDAIKSLDSEIFTTNCNSEAVAQTMIGTAQLILQNKSNPESEIDKI